MTDAITLTAATGDLGDMNGTAARQRRRAANLTLFAASAGCAMTVLDTNIVGVVLPSIARDLGASFANIEWVVTTYVLCFAALLLPAGAVADRFGRRRVYLIGIALFAGASLLCGIAGSAVLLCAARALQGVGAAFLLASALAIIGHAFHDEAERGRAWAIWGGIMGLTMVLSPLLGGAIAAVLNWRWAFFVNLPICALLAAAVIWVISESRDPAARRLDPLGIVLFSGGMFALIWALIGSAQQGWSSTATIARFAAGIALLVAFIIAETCQRAPMLDLGLFRNRRFVGAILAMFGYAAAAQVMASLLPQYLQNGLGRSALMAGAAMLPFALAMLILPQAGRWLAHYWPGYRILAAGLAVVAIGNALTGWAALHDAPVLVAIGMAVLGSGGGLLNGETQKAIMGSVPPGRAGMASGISTTARFTGILLGFATLGAVLAAQARTALLPALTSAAMTSAASSGDAGSFIDRVVAGDIAAALAPLPPASRDAALDIARHGYGHGFAMALYTAGAIAAIASVAVFLLMRPGRKPA